MELRDLISGFDAIIWMLVLVFFLTFALVGGENIGLAVLSSLAVIAIMTVVGISIEVIIDILKNVKGLGTVLGFITNGPELVVLIVGIAVADPLFGSSTPLGSNVINPIMLLLAALITGMFISLMKERLLYGAICIVVTAIIAVTFYALPESAYIHWLVVGLIASLGFFIFRPTEEVVDCEDSKIPFWALLPAMLTLSIAGYFLDPVVEFAGDVCNVPKGLIGFFVLATLSSWPEFKSCLVLFREKRIQAAMTNIFVSNITNIWLALIGVAVYVYFVL